MTTSLKDMKPGPVKAIVEREIREFANEVEQVLTDHPADDTVRKHIANLMEQRGIAPKQ